MKIIKLFFPGQFEDSFLYRGRLVLFTADRSIKVYAVRDILNELNRQIPANKSMNTLLFEQNDFLSHPSFQLLMKDIEFRGAIQNMLDRYPNEYLNMNAVRPSFIDMKLNSKKILDVNIYAGRIYYGADDGFYEFDADWNDGPEIYPVHSDGKPVKRLDARCFNTSARLGAVLASCGNDGLFSAVDDFNWQKTQGFLTKKIKMQKIAKKSVRSRWWYSDLVNYATQVDANVLSTETQKLDSRVGEQEKRILVGFKDEELNILDEIRKHFGEEIPTKSVQYLFNHNRNFFIHTYDGEFYSVRMSHVENEPIRVIAKKTYKGQGTRIIGAHPTLGGTIIETDTKIFYFSNSGDWKLIENSEAISTRTFRTSIKYKNITTITKEDGVLVTSIVDTKLSE